MKRFWTDSSVVEGENGFGVMLDGRPLKTPARVALAVPTRALADAIAAEWAAAGETIDPRAMPMTGLANAAVDRADEQLVAGITRYAESDHLCYRAPDPAPLVDRQAEAWDPLLGWARRRFDVDFATCNGIIHVAQPSETVRKLSHAVTSLERFHLAALSPLVTIGGSLVAGLAVLEKAIPVEEAWTAVSLDERWQLEQWGSDAEAEAMLAAKRDDFFAAAAFLDLLS
ncbi:MAG: ATPase [Sphingomonas bacterium]|nr:ATPase [Sphingomonas bacterium]